MRTFAQKPATLSSAAPARPSMARPVLSREMQQANTACSLHPAPRVSGAATPVDLSQIPVRGLGRLQAKLVLGSPGDVYEQEADRIADVVTRGPAPPVVDDARPPTMRSATTGHAEALMRRGDEAGSSGGCELEPALGAGIDAMRGAGRPLGASERQFMEARFATDFSGIRIHADPQSDRYNCALGARAFTLGGDIFFRAGEYTPGRSAGRRLLAHELTHAVQQGAARPVPGKGDLGIRSAAPPSVQRDLAVAPPKPAAVAPVLTEEQIAAAIDFNRRQFKGRTKSLRKFRDVIGLSPTPAVADREMALKIAGWQAVFELEVDGKAGDRTVGTIVRELKAEELSPDAMNILLDLYGNVPASIADLNFLPVRYVDPAIYGPFIWGATLQADPIVDISVFAGPDGWGCVVTKAEQQCRQGVRLLDGVVEVTPELIAAEADCAVLRTMKSDLDATATETTGFYMLAAVQAHENVHITQYRDDLAPLYTTFRTAVEALTVPLASCNGPKAAKSAIKELAEYEAAWAAFLDGELAVNNDTASHTVPGPFRTAEHGIVDPMIRLIEARIERVCPKPKDPPKGQPSPSNQNPTTPFPPPP